MSGRDGHVQAHRSLGCDAKSHRANAQSVTPPRQRPVTARISDIKSSLRPHHIEAICKDWLPAGKRQGGWWVCCCPWREDTHPSFGVSLTTGKWRDFAKGDHGDMLDLAMKMFGDSLVDTVAGFEDMLGISRA